MVYTAVMGYGVVGGGVVDVIENNRDLFQKKLGDDIQVKYILDIRDLPEDKNADKLTKDFNVIVEDREVSIVVEAIGGCKAAYEYTKKCLAASKSVVTSNKELVATHGPELLEIAKASGAHYFFEAAVGGGIPVIRPLANCLSANRITKIIGILNGTTNYILTKMISDRMPFDEALCNAQRLGYAEANPSADVEGKDTCRKIAILASIAFGRHIYPENVYTRGISDIAVEDMQRADSMGYAIKLLGCAQLIPGGDVEIFVSPCAIKKTHNLAHVHDVFNGVQITGDMVGDVTFIGRGAGKLPTASAVCSDIIDAAIDDASYDIYWQDRGSGFIRSFDRLTFKYLDGTDIPVVD